MNLYNQPNTSVDIAKEKGNGYIKPQAIRGNPIPIKIDSKDSDNEDGN